MANSPKENLVLAGDIGGTKTNLGLFSMGKRRPLLRIMHTYSSRDALRLEEIVDQFVKKYSVSVDSACFGIAGPIKNGRSKTTNLPWEVSEAKLKKRFGWPQVCLINDLAATAYAIPFLGGKEVFSLNKSRTAKRQPIGLVAPGTGLGMALLIWSDNGFVPVPSEGGHMDFGPNSEAEVTLWRYLRRRFGHVSMERVLSGPGLFNIYSCLKNAGRYKEPVWLRKKTRAQNSSKAVTEAALERKTPLAVAALRMFVSIFGAVAGNLALAGMTTGGMYLGGGIPPKILSFLKKDGFLEAYEDKGRFRDFLKSIPVRVILNDKAALLGAAQYAFSRKP